MYLLFAITTNSDRKRKEQMLLMDPWKGRVESPGNHHKSTYHGRRVKQKVINNATQASISI